MGKKGESVDGETWRHWKKGVCVCMEQRRIQILDFVCTYPKFSQSVCLSFFSLVSPDLEQPISQTEDCVLNRKYMYFALPKFPTVSMCKQLVIILCFGPKTFFWQG